ncbi:hypothetical protein NQZ68_001925 [Dissostichus eleginoides]|nr:hypothetical protein NQZ68_001925 [Dissostichus eleginoides]
MTAPLSRPVRHEQQTNAPADWINQQKMQSENQRLPAFKELCSDNKLSNDEAAHSREQSESSSVIYSPSRMQSVCVRRLWGSAQVSRLLKVTNINRSVRQLQHKKDMEDNKPWALTSEPGKEGFIEDLTLIRKHFQILCYKDFLQNPQLHGPKIQAVLVFGKTPPTDPSTLRSLPSLKVVANGGVGIDHLDVPYINSLGVKVTNTPGVVSDATADVALGLLLASARKIVQGHQISVDPNTTNHKPKSLMGVEVTGSTMGIIGMGHIGCRIAQRGKGFDMKILYHNRTRRSVEDEQAVGATYCEKMDDLLKESDFVVLAVNLSPETTGLISTRELNLMKPTATLVNVSRGRVVDQDALVKALQSETILAAALDVTYPEPLPRDHPLLGLPNVLITPHVGTDTFSTSRKIVQRMVENAVAVLKGQSIPNEVKPK